MDVRKSGRTNTEKRSPTLEKLARRRQEERQRATSTGSSAEDEGSISNVPDPRVVPIEISGNLHKQGRLLKKWKPRFFQVQGTCLYYFKNYEKKECLGLIDLRKCYYIGKSNAASFGFSFELQTWGRIHLLAARDERDAEKWIKVIQRKMEPEARERDKKGTKGDVNAVIPDEIRTRRATIKMTRTARKDKGVKPSKSAHEITMGEGLKSFDENEEEEGELDIGKPLEGPITGSHSFPELKSHQVVSNTSQPVADRDLNQPPSQPTIEPPNQRSMEPPSDQALNIPSRQQPSTSETALSQPPPVQQVRQPLGQSPNQLPQSQRNDSEINPHHASSAPPQIVQHAHQLQVDLPPPLELETPTATTTSIAAIPYSQNIPQLPEVANIELLPPLFGDVTASNNQLESSGKKPMRRTQSVADIELPPPISFIPIKRSNTISDIELPPPLDIQFADPLKQADQNNDVMNLLPPPVVSIPNGQPADVGVTDIELPQPPTLLATVNNNVQPDYNNVTMELPAPIIGSDNALPAPSLEQTPSTAEVERGMAMQMETVGVERLKQMLIPLHSLQHIPSSIDQLKYVLSSGEHDQGGSALLPKQYVVLPEMDKTWFTEGSTGIEQLHHFLIHAN